MVNWIGRFIAKRKALRNSKHKDMVIQDLDKNESKLFELFKIVLKNHTYICKFDSDREVHDTLTSILITDSVASNEMCILVKKNDGITLEFFLNSQKSYLFKDDFDKVIKRLSIRHSFDKKKGLEKHLDELIIKENKKK